MRAERKEKRQQEIEAIAYKLLEEQGFEGTSMAKVAKGAKASMETLYSWYGDKNGLFSALVKRNSLTVLAILDRVNAAGDPPEEKIKAASIALLSMLTDPKAIALNRAAISDTSGTLGPLLAQSGRSVVGPRIAQLMVQWRDTGALAFEDIPEATAVYISLLVGDHQIRRATGAIPPLTTDEVATRADRAMELFRRIYGVTT